MKNIFTPTLFAILAIAAQDSCAAPHSCTGVSGITKNWLVKDFDYHASYIFSTPSHQNSWGYVNFTLHNDPVKYEASCTASSDQLEDFFYGNFPRNCTVDKAGDAAAFTFDRPTGQLNINQTWNCQEGSRWVATGGVKLDLVCKEEKWQNPDWKMGEFYSTRTVTCEKVTVKAPLQIVSGVN